MILKASALFVPRMNATVTESAVARVRPPSPAPSSGAASAPGKEPVPPVPPVVVTPPGVEVTPDGLIGQPGTQPAPTLPAIAAELKAITVKTYLVVILPT